MESLIRLLKFLAPGTAQFFVLAAGTAALLLRWPGRSRQVGAACGIALLTVYAAMALPWTAARISKSLRQDRRVLDLQAAGGASVVVVLAGDSEHSRVIETLRLYSIVHPTWVVVEGPKRMGDELVDAGIPPDRVLVEGGGRTTREQMINVARIVQSRNLGRFVLVASAIHMPRALATARTLGLDLVPSASATRRIAGRPAFWPAIDALRLSRESIYEYVALAYYRWNGWTDGG